MSLACIAAVTARCAESRRHSTATGLPTLYGHPKENDMDVPPTTTVDVVQHESQPSIEALHRLVATRDALVRLLQIQPSLNEADQAGAQRLLVALPIFWSASDPVAGEPRKALLGRYLASVMKEEATLRSHDGTLSGDAAALSARITGMGDGPLPAGTHVRELMLGEVPRAGSLIVIDDGAPDIALLFTAQGGWEAFDSLDRLLSSTRHRLLQSVDVAEGSGLEDDLLAEAKASDMVGSREIDGFVFETLASRMIDVQFGRITLAVDDFLLDRDEPGAARELGDRLRHELSPAALLDIEGIERMREARLLEASVASRLASVPEPVRSAWYEARDAYNDTLAAAALLRSVAGIRPPLTLHAFASRELATKLAALGVDDAPETITVEAARIQALPESLASLDPLPGSTQARRIPLIDFAAQNLARFSLDTLHAFAADGSSLRGRLGQAAIRDMVRELDVATRYQAHLEDRLRQGVVGALTRKLGAAVQGAQMRLEAAEARLSYYLPNEPHSFIDDRDERGFRWVEAALDETTGTRRVDGHDIAVSQLTYQGVALDGILIFASRAPDSAPRTVMYTPDAPDGRHFREFESRQDAAKQLLYHPAFREYLLDRLPAEFATVLPNGASRRFAGDRLAHWVLGAGADVPYTLTAEPFGEREVRGDFLLAAHDTTIDRYRRDTRFLARSTAGVDQDALVAHLQDRFNGGAGANLVAAALAEVPTSLARMAQASWRFYDHVKAGNDAAAVVAFADAYVNALNLVAPPFVGGRQVAGAIVRSRSSARGVTTTGVRIAPPAVRFEDRYAARGMGKIGRPDDEGIFRTRGESFVEQDGSFFLVRYDTDYGRWRLMPRQGALDARFSGPVIERVDGRWIHASEVGLRGGMRRVRQRLARLVLRDEPRAGVVADALPDPAPAAPAPGNASPPIALPPAMESARAEITAVLTDNPSATVFVRPDGTHLKFSVPPRSAMIMEPHLHPDLAELSAHQRRIFLHELDNAFPLRTERSEVLSIQGWARRDGRRIRSRTPSPDDVQSPEISSSTGDSLPPAPALSVGQQQRWDQALDVARGAPRTSRPASPAAASATNDVLPPTEVVPADEWPSRIWYYSERQIEPETFFALGTEGVTLGRWPVWIDEARGIRSQPVSTLPPETPVSQLGPALGASPVQQAGQRDPFGYSMLIDLARLRDALRAGRAVLGEADIELHRRLLPNGEYRYTLQSRGPLRIPSTYIVSVARRLGQPRRLPAVRY
jgi:hypothetical protein